MPFFRFLCVHVRPFVIVASFLYLYVFVLVLQRFPYTKYPSTPSSLLHSKVMEVFVWFTERTFKRPNPFVLLITGLSRIFTVIIIEAVFFPYSVVTVIIAIPFPIAVTLPFSSTAATISLSDFQISFWASAFSGSILTFSSVDSPIFVSVSFSASIEIFSISTGIFTVTATVAV